MGIIWDGKTKCKICNKVLKNSDTIISYPDIIYDKNDPLHFFSGQNFHVVCISNHELSKKAIEILEKNEAYYEEKKCMISNKLITLETIKHPDNHIYI